MKITFYFSFFRQELRSQYNLIKFKIYNFRMCPSNWSTSVWWHVWSRPKKFAVWILVLFRKLLLCQQALQWCVLYKNTSKSCNFGNPWKFGNTKKMQNIFLWNLFKINVCKIEQNLFNSLCLGADIDRVWLKTPFKNFK